MFGVEIGKSLRRLRTWVFAAGLALVGVLPVLVVGSGGSSGPAFLDQVRHNGLFGSLAALALLQGFFLPLGTALLSGEAIAGEAALGTLRYLMVRPVGRRRLVVEKYLAVMAQVGAAVAWVSVVGGVAGAFAFGFGPFPTLSGVTIGNGEAVLRVLAAAAYVLAGVSGIAAIGMFLSTLTVGGLGASGATLAVAIGSEVLDNLSRLRAVHPFLPTHGWPAFADLFRSPIGWSAIAHGLVLDAAYVAVFLGGALLVFSRKDVTD